MAHRCIWWWRKEAYIQDGEKNLPRRRVFEAEPHDLGVQEFQSLGPCRKRMSRVLRVGL